MSSLYIHRLRAIEIELNAARAALSYVERRWQSQDIHREIGWLTPHDFNQANQNVERTYFLRLYAEFEGILKDHLAINHAQVRVPDKSKIDWLISRVVQAESLPIEQALLRRMDITRDYRNSIAHRSQRGVLLVPFGDALPTLNTFLARLPDPYT